MNVAQVHWGSFNASERGAKRSDIWIYLIANFLGGATAAVVFMYAQPAEKDLGDTRAAEPADYAGGTGSRLD